MRRALPFVLWIWMALCLWAAFYYSPAAAEGFEGQSIRIVFFHVPLAWTAFVAFFSAAVWSGRYLWGGRRPGHDRGAAIAIELGFLFCALATITGSLWAKVEWNAFWNWDPRQISIVMVLLFYGAYLALRSAVADRETRARLSAAYALVGVVVAPFFFFIVPRITYSLHPEPVINADRQLDMEPRIFQVLLASFLAYSALFFWIHDLRSRAQALAERAEER